MSWFKKFLYILAFPLSGMLLSAGDLTADSRWQRSFKDVQALKFREADQRILYGEADSQFVDLWLPRGKVKDLAPVVVLIHGGCWLEQYDISHIRPLATALSNQGYAVWGIEYRRVGQQGGGWPGTFQDISAAVDLLRDFRNPQLNQDHAVFLGHSAGGHLALWAAGRSRLTAGQELYQEYPIAPVGVVGLAAITDLREYALGNNSCQEITTQLMGGMPDQFPQRYEQASPALLGIDVPVVLLQGQADVIVPLSQASALSSARVVMLKNAGHFDLIHTDSPAFTKLVDTLNRLRAK